MYRVILADDEESIRNRLLAMMDKLKDDFQVVGCFENGFDAVESGIPLEPDVIITDIRMPYISGMELIKQTKSELPLVQSLIVSGYDSFDYAKEAIDLGVIGYITKPIIFEEFKAAMDKVKQALDSQLTIDKNIKHLEEKAQTTLKILQSEDLNKLVTIKEVPENLRKKLLEDEIALEGKYQMFIIMDSDSDELPYDEQDLFHLYLEKYFQDEFCKEFKFYTFFRDNHFTVLVETDNQPNIERLVNKLNEILAKVKRTTGISVSCGLSDIMSKPINYRKIYRHAKRSLEYRTVMGHNLVLYFPDLEKEDGQSSKVGKIDDNEYRNLTYLISYGKKQDVYEKIENIIDTISSPSYKDNYYFILTNIMDSILKACLSLPEFYQKFDSQSEITKVLYSLKSKESTVEFFNRMVECIVDINDNKRLSGLESSFERIKKYLEVNYTNPNLSIEDVAKELAYSISYISAILKKNGTSFTKMTTDLRMRKAVELLGNSENRIISIAKAVGYSDPYYFSHCFKKYSGLSPDDYRKNKAA